MQADNVTTSTTAAAAANATPDSESSSPLVFEGSCYCRSVSWKLEGEPLFSIYCHCTMCQRMNGATFIHVLHYPLASFKWTNPNPPETAVTQSQPSSSHSWITYHCKTCHSYIGSANSVEKAWSVRSAPFKRDEKTNLIEGFERIRPTAHIFYGTRLLDVPDGLPKWDGYGGKSNRLDLA